MEVKSLKDLEKIVRFCRKQGITSLKHGEFEIQLSPQALFPVSAYKQKQSDEPIETQSFSEEDALYWSSAGIPERYLEDKASA